MARDIDERKKRKALRKLRKAQALAEQGLGPPLSDWETQFLEEVEARIEKYGSAFADPEKGGKDEPLSALQNVKLREIDKKARGKAKSGFKKTSSFSSKKKKAFSPRVRRIDDDLNETEGQPIETPKPGLKLIQDNPPKPAAKPSRSKPKFRVIKGGADEA